MNLWLKCLPNKWPKIDILQKLKPWPLVCNKTQPSCHMVESDILFTYKANMSKQAHLQSWFIAPIRYKSLLREFIYQDINTRFANSIGGLLWTVINPLVTILIYVFIFSVIMKMRVSLSETGTDQFAVYLLAGLLPWMAFADAFGRSTGLLLEKSSLITKVAFPVHILPYAGAMVAYILNGIGFGLFLLNLLFNGYLAWTWWLLPLVLGLQFLFTMGLVAFSAAICVFLRALQQVFALLLSVWFFLTPIIYPLSMVPDSYRAWFYLNPFYFFVELYRQLLLRQHLDVHHLLIVSLVSLCVFVLGGWFFMRIQRSFGDVL